MKIYRITNCKQIQDTFSIPVSSHLLLTCIFAILFLLNSPEAISDSLLTTNNEINSPEITASILKVTAGLVLVIAAILLSAWFYRRFGNLSPVANESLKIIGGISIGQKEKAILLQVGEEQILVGVAPGNIQKLHVLKTPIILNNDHKNENRAFADQLGSAIKKWKNK